MAPGIGANAVVARNHIRSCAECALRRCRRCACAFAQARLSLQRPPAANSNPGLAELKYPAPNTARMVFVKLPEPPGDGTTALRFAPYPPLPAALAATAFAAASGLRADHNEWNHVEDFDWLKATHSPNWAELPEAEREAPVWE